MVDVALVTGGIGGIGRAIDARLAQEGYVVVAGDVGVAPDASPLGAVQPGTVVELRMDVTSPQSVDAAVSAAAALGRLRAVVNCAGIVREAFAATMDDERAAAIWDVNVAGAARVCRAALPHLEAGAAIVNIGSIAGRVGRFAGLAMYSASKAALEGMTRVLACELGPRGIRVNAVAPGFIRVPMSGDWERMSGGEQALVRQVPLGRLGETAEVAEVVEFLLSPRASYIDGAVIYVDGGTAAW